MSNRTRRALVLAAVLVAVGSMQGCIIIVPEYGRPVPGPFFGDGQALEAGPATEAGDPVARTSGR